MRGKCRRVGAGNRTCNGARWCVGTAFCNKYVSFCLIFYFLNGTCVPLLREEGQQNMYRHVFPIIVECEVVHWQSACNVSLFCLFLRYICSVIKRRGTCTGTYAQSSSIASWCVGTTFATYTYGTHILCVIKRRGASADAWAPATEHAPACSPNLRPLRGGA